MQNLFIGVFPEGLVYADKSREEHGDYKHVAFLSYATLRFHVRDEKSPLLKAAREHAASVQDRAGQEYEISAAGQTVTLGHGVKVLNLTCCCCGQSTKGRQWWNRDTGYGLCPGCAAWIAQRESPEQMKQSYGIPEYHYFTKES
jgi:hypothetical protein